MEIVEAVAPERVLIKLDFLKPFEAHNMAEYLLVESDGATEFTWAMYGPNNLLSKLMGLFFNMDRMVGAQFEQGLRRSRRWRKGARHDRRRLPVRRNPLPL
jgi:hypothetical protein